MFPRITIITPSYNQGSFLERTICSVLDQNYPNLEYIIIDGGSTDKSLDIIRKYSDKLSYWVSEPDQGQTEAINKRLMRATGDWVAWQNSDDIYFPGVFNDLAKTTAAHPKADLIIGNMMLIDEFDQPLRDLRYVTPNYNSMLAEGMLVANQAAFWRRDLQDKFGLLDESFDFSFDYEWFLRLTKNTKGIHVPKTWGALRVHGETKSSQQVQLFQEENHRILVGREIPAWRKHWYKLRRLTLMLGQGQIRYILRGMLRRASQYEGFRVSTFKSNSPILDSKNGSKFAFKINRPNQTDFSNLDNPCVFAIIPVFNRLSFTRNCIEQLLAQTYSNIKIILSDGGSTDNTVGAIGNEFPQVTILKANKTLWWSGAMAAGINFAKANGSRETDFILMMNNDTNIKKNYVATLVEAAKQYKSAVGGLIVDYRNGDILDAGEYIDWENYAFPVEKTPRTNEKFRDDVDVLPGRGTLFPIRWVTEVGNVNAELFPHYLGDYDFFYRLKKRGYRLGVCYDATVESYTDETGIVGGVLEGSFENIFKELFSRRSMTNIVDHWRFINNHAPHSTRNKIKLKLAYRFFHSIVYRATTRSFNSNKNGFSK